MTPPPMSSPLYGHDNESNIRNRIRQEMESGEPHTITSKEEIPRDIPLYRCVYRKSKSVTKNILKMIWTLLCSLVKPILYILIAIGTFIGFIAICIYIILPFGESIWNPIINSLNSISQFFMSIPWYLWILAIGILAIPTYSLFWCIDRDLTAEDRYQNKFLGIQFIFAIIGLFIGSGITIYLVGSDIWMILFGIMSGGLGGVILGVNIGSLFDAMRYHNHRIKEKNKNV